MGLRRFLLGLSVILIVGLVLTVWFMPLKDDFRDATPYWNGISDITGEYPVHLPASLSDLPPSPFGVTLILIPYMEYSPAELELLNGFVSQGGRLILADDYGNGNQVLASLGLEGRFSGQPLLDPMVNYKTKQFPGITRLEPNPLTSNVTSMVFNHATSLTNVSANDIIAQSSAFSFLDLNDNGSSDAGEPAGPQPVISQQTLGSGQVILIADPSIFINGMRQTGDNTGFIQNIFATAPNGVYFDLSHLPVSNLKSTKHLLAQARSLMINPTGMILLIVVLLWLVLLPIWYKKKQSKSA
jgi:hypothetical protein